MYQQSSSREEEPSNSNPQPSTSKNGADSASGSCQRIAFEVVFNKKGQQAIVLDHYLYNYSHWLRSGSLAWICAERKGCSALITTNAELTCILGLNEKPHIHEPLTAKQLTIIRLRHAIKLAATEDLTKKPAEVVMEQVKKFGDAEISFVERSNLRQSVCYQRRK